MIWKPSMKHTIGKSSEGSKKNWVQWQGTYGHQGYGYFVLSGIIPQVVIKTAIKNQELI